MSTADCVRSTRITPDQLEPAVGEEYRSRKTGEIVRLIGHHRGNTDAIVVIQVSNGVRNAIGIDLFWREFIHAKARQ